MEQIGDAIEQKIDDIKEEFDDDADEIHEAADDIDDEEDGYDIPDFVSSEKNTKLDEFKENAMKTVNESIDNVKEAADQFMSKPEVKNAVDNVKDNVNKAVETAKVHIA